MRISARIQIDAPDSGNIEPDSSHSGIRNRLMTAWKPPVESIGHAMMKPSAVSENATRKMTTTVSSEARQREVNSEHRREHEKDEALQGSQRRSAEHLAQHDHRAADRRHQHREQKAFFAVFDHRHHGEDGGEQHDHDQRAGEEVVEVMLASRAARAERRAEARADHQPEQQRRSDDADHPAAFAGKSAQSRATTAKSKAGRRRRAPERAILSR